MRRVCADSLRKSTESYAPFAELQEGEDFEGYCHRVETSSDWGGELELRALADALQETCKVPYEPVCIRIRIVVICL